MHILICSIFTFSNEITFSIIWNVKTYSVSFDCIFTWRIAGQSPKPCPRKLNVIRSVFAGFQCLSVEKQMHNAIYVLGENPERKRWSVASSSAPTLFASVHVRSLVFHAMMAFKTASPMISVMQQSWQLRCENCQNAAWLSFMSSCTTWHCKFLLLCLGDDQVCAGQGVKEGSWTLPMWSCLFACTVAL